MAVSRIQRIKENFTKKRLQIHMLAVKQEPEANQDSSDYVNTGTSQLRSAHLASSQTPSEAVHARMSPTRTITPKRDAEPSLPTISNNGPKIKVESLVVTQEVKHPVANLNSYLT